MSERRSQPRRKTYLGGVAIFNHRQSAMDCVLRNMGHQGARLAFAYPVALPDEFDLQVARLGRSFRARTAWRSRDELGVRFMDAASDAKVIPLDYAVRIRALQDDKARLERRVADLTSG